MSVSSQVEARGGEPRLVGARCHACSYPFAPPGPLCPACGCSDVVSDSFGPQGTVAASTVVWIAVAGREPPFGLAYVDLHHGPRVLAQAPVPPPGPGARVRLTAAEVPTVEAV